MNERFMDLLSLEIPTEILDSFEIPSDEIQGSCGLEADLIDLRHDFKLKPFFEKQQYQDFWLQQAVTREVSITMDASKAFLYCFSDFIFGGERIRCGVTNFNKSQEPSQCRRKRRFASSPHNHNHHTRYWKTNSHHQVGSSHWLWVIIIRKMT